MENGNGLIVDGARTCTEGCAERKATLKMLRHLPYGKTVTGYGPRLRHEGFCLSVPRASSHATCGAEPLGSELGDRRAHDGHERYRTGQQARKVRLCGLDRVTPQVPLSFTAYNRVRIRNLLAEVA